MMVRPARSTCAAVTLSRRNRCSTSAKARTAARGLSTHIVGDRQALTCLEFVGGLAHQNPTAAGRENARDVVVCQPPHEHKTFDAKQRRADRSVEETRLARTRDLRLDLMLHPVDDDTGGREQLVERFALQR